MLYIASDHGGFHLKNYLIKFLAEKGIEITDMGAQAFDENDDYPDFVIPVVRKLQENPNDRAILICRNGVGVSVAANRFKGIRTGLSWNSVHAASSRADDDTNVLALGADYINAIDAEEIVLSWLNTSFSGSERHKRRLEKIEALL